MPAPEASSVDADNPWLGLSSFTEDTQAYFFGREAEVAELARRVQRKLLTVLFGKSGLGKTSILRAGLVPRLRVQGYIPVYLRIDYGRDSPEAAEQIKQAINRAVRGIDAQATGQAGAAEVAAGQSIWEFLHHRDDVLKDAAGSKLVPLLIFDQFEELFTLAQADEFGRARAAKFVEELADLVENRPPKALEARLESEEGLAERFDFSRSDYRVVIALREDYLAQLESLKKQMPSLSQNRLRLAPMTGSQALEAVLRPGNQPPPGNDLRARRHLVSQEVAEAIVRFVAGGSELANAEVEPSLLSLICRELNEQRIAQQRSEITQDLLAGSHDTILSSFYERALADQPAAVRRIIEDDLLTESGHRENLSEEGLLRRFQAAGAAPDALATLVNRRLLRIEERLDVRRVELTHDVLTGVVKASRDQRHEREAREATERVLAEQRHREQVARQALRRARVIAGGCTLLAAAAIIAAGIALVSVQRARRAEAEAQQTRIVSEQARRQAQGLLSYLTDNFVEELLTFGRYQFIAELSQREIDYFRALPEALKDPQTVRSGALALVNHAQALVYLGDLGAAARDATQALTQMQQARRSDSSDPTAAMLARAYEERAEVAIVQNDLAGYRRDLAPARELLRPIAERAGAQVAFRRAYVELLAGAAFGEAFITFDDDDAVRDAREAMQMAVQLGARRGTDVVLNAQYATAGAGLIYGLFHLGRNEEALSVGKDVLGVEDEAVSQRPQYAAALVAKQFSEMGLGAASDGSLDPAAAVRLGLQSVRTSEALIQVEPQNGDYANNLAVIYLSLIYFARDAGQLRESADYARKSVEAFARAGAGSTRPLSVPYSYFAAYLGADQQAERGDLRGAEAIASEETALVNKRHLPPEAALAAVAPLAAAAAAYERGDFTAAQRLLREIQARWSEPHSNIADQGWCDLYQLQGRADYDLGDFGAAEQVGRAALQPCARGATNTAGRGLATARVDTLLALALASGHKTAEAAKVIGPVLQFYREQDTKNRSEAWLPLELAQALYAQALADPQHHQALLAEAARKVAHLAPQVAALHATQRWRARIEAARYTPTSP